MGLLSKESKKLLIDENINPKTNKPFKKTCMSPDNIIKKIIRIIIRQLNKLLNNNIIDKERYYELSKILKINGDKNNNKKDINETFKQLEENNKYNSLTNVTVDNYEKISNMTIKEILESLNISKIYKNYFPFHNTILMNLIRNNNKESKINKLLDLTFSQCLIIYQYFPLFFEDGKSKDSLNSSNENTNYYFNKIENFKNNEEIINLKNELKDINFEGINSLLDTIIYFQNKKDEDNNLKYKDEYIKKYIDMALGYHEFFLNRKRNRAKGKNKIKNKNEENYQDDAGFSTKEE
jgi:hypothetical protein